MKIVTVTATSVKRENGKVVVDDKGKAVRIVLGKWEGNIPENHADLKAMVVKGETYEGESIVDAFNTGFALLKQRPFHVVPANPKTAAIKGLKKLSLEELTKLMKAAGITPLS